MASKFKLFDRVKCTNADDVQGLTKGKIYRVTEPVSSSLVSVVDDYGSSTPYYPSRFELAPPETPGLDELDESQLMKLRERINQKLIDQDWEAKRRAKLDVTRGEFEDLKAAVNAPK